VGVVFYIKGAKVRYRLGRRCGSFLGILKAGTGDLLLGGQDKELGEGRKCMVVSLNEEILFGMM